MIKYDKIKELKKQIALLEKELKFEQEVALEVFRNMSVEDCALSENKLVSEGVAIQYFPKSEVKTVDTKKLKEDGLFDQYSKISQKTDYIRITMSKDEN